MEAIHMTESIQRRRTGGAWSALTTGLCLAATLSSAQANDGAKSTKDQLLELTGGRRVKVVWAQNAQDANHTNSPIKLFDTKDGVIRELPFTGIQACLTPDGTRVLAVTGPKTDRVLKMYNTDSGAVTDLATGPHTFPLFIWRDPKTGREWVYVNAIGAGGEFQRGWEAGQDTLYRLPLDRPSERELVWDRTTISEFFMLSADGTRACLSPTFFNIGQMAFAFDREGRIDPEASTFKPLGRGCFPGIAPDNSYRLFILTGNHRAITMFDADGANRREINVSNMPGVDGRQVWLTRWSTHPRYLTLMGPDSNEARIWMGRFNEDYTEVEAWVQVNSDGPKAWKSHAWVEQDPVPGAGRPGTDRTPTTPAVPPPEWPAVAGAVFSLRDTNIGAPRVAFDDRGRDLMAFSFVERGRAIYGRNHELVCDGGSFIAQDAGAWIAKQVAEAGAFTIEAVVTPTEVTPTTKGVLMTFADDRGEDFAILQDKNWLFLRLKDTPPIGLFAVEAGKTVHMMVAFQDGKGVIYRNGRAVRTGPLPATAAAWTPRELVLGAAGSGAEPWRGRLDCIAVYPRALAAEDAARQASAVQGVYAKRTPPTTIRFKGTLQRQAPTSHWRTSDPTPAASPPRSTRWTRCSPANGPSRPSWSITG
jgi:hypothetical protein